MRGLSCRSDPETIQNALDMDALGNLGEVANKYDVYDAGEP